MNDPRYAPKTLDDCAAEFRGMMEDAIRQQHFEVAATCKSFLRAVESAAGENAKLREALTRIHTLPVSERKWSTAMDIAGTALGIV